MEAEKLRAQEPLAKRGRKSDAVSEMAEDFRRRHREGRVVVKGREIPFQQGRQGLIKTYLAPDLEDLPPTGFLMFIHDIRTHSGKHRHQGGTALFVLEGEGYTVVDGERVDWEAGDLILLPIKPAGVDHQHFNKKMGEGCKWLSFIYLPIKKMMGHPLNQIENSPDWKGEN